MIDTEAVIGCSIELLEELKDGSLLNIETPFLPEYQNAIETAIRALRKRMAKKPIIKRESFYFVAVCPECGYDFYSYTEDGLAVGRQAACCPVCGQQMNWSEHERPELR